MQPQSEVGAGVLVFLLYHVLTGVHVLISARKFNAKRRDDRSPSGSGYRLGIANKTPTKGIHEKNNLSTPGRNPCALRHV